MQVIELHWSRAYDESTLITGNLLEFPWSFLLELEILSGTNDLGPNF